MVKRPEMKVPDDTDNLHVLPAKPNRLAQRRVPSKCPGERFIDDDRRLRIAVPFEIPPVQ